MNKLHTYRWGVLLVFGWAFSACCSDADLIIKAPLRNWISLQPPAEIKFLSAAGDTVGFWVTTQEYYQPARDQACGAYRVQTLATTYTLITDPTVKALVSVSHEAVINIQVNAPRQNNPVLNVKYNAVSGLFISPDFRDKYLRNMPFGGAVYPEVLHVYGVANPGTMFFADFIYAKKVGLIGFKTFDNKWYTLL